MPILVQTYFDIATDINLHNTINAISPMHIAAKFTQTCVVEALFAAISAAHTLEHSGWTFLSVFCTTTFSIAKNKMLLPARAK